MPSTSIGLSSSSASSSFLEILSTCEYLNVLLEKDGEMAGFGNSMTEQFDKFLSKKSATDIEKMVERFASDEAKKAIDERIPVVYPSVKSYEITGKRIVLLDDDTLGMAYTIGIDFMEGWSYLETLIVTEE